MVKYKRSECFLLIFILFAATVWKGLLLYWDVVPFNSDEAIVALMARHILQGQVPIFFYGQAYMGSLDALLSAGMFLIIGQQVLAIRLLQMILFLLFIITTVEIGRIGFGSVKKGLIAASLFCFPTANLALYSTASLGGYGEALLIGNLIIITGLSIWDRTRNEKPTWLLLLILGFLIGLGLWANGLTLVYSFPVGLLTWGAHVKLGKGSKLRNGLTTGLILGSGFLLGALPWWVYAFQNGILGLVNELMGTAVNVGQTGFFQQVFNRIINFTLLGMSAFLGFRPPWEIRWLALPLIPFILFFWGWVLIWTVRKMVKREPDQNVYWFLFGTVFTLMLGFILTPFGNDPSGRYFLPLTVPFVLAAADWIASLEKKLWQVGLIGGVVLFQLAGTWQCASIYPPGITTQFDAVTWVDHRYDEELITFLKQENETRGYSNYWVVYPLAFKSGEELIYIPRLPYHPDFRYTARDDRYPPYREIVNASPRAAYITTHHPDLDQYLREAFNRKGVHWKEKVIGDYRIFYHLSNLIRPEDIGLGETINSQDYQK